MVVIMYVIVVYDVKSGRTEKARKICQRYLQHVQNSVFEGKISKGDIKQLKSNLDNLHQEDESIMLYIIDREQNLTREIYGTDSTDEDIFL